MAQIHCIRRWRKILVIVMLSCVGWSLIGYAATVGYDKAYPQVTSPVIFLWAAAASSVTTLVIWISANKLIQHRRRRLDLGLTRPMRVIVVHGHGASQ